jgi:hypothetical protein
MLLVDLEKRELIKPPSFLATNTMYLTRMGSTAYGVSTDNSDLDVYGVCIPPRDYIFPPNYIEGFDTRDLTFHQWQQHHILDKSANGGKGCSYDFSIYGIINYFKLVMDNNPNVLESLFVRREHIMHITNSWGVVRDNRKLFLHKGVVHKMRGYSYNQLASARNCIEHIQPIRRFEEDLGIPHSTTYRQAVERNYEISDKDYYTYIAMWDLGISKTKRFESQKIHNTDVKFLYHVFRLMDQAEFILNNFDLDLQEESRVAKMKAIRSGQLTYDQVAEHFSNSEQRLLNLYETSKLPMRPDKDAIKSILMSVLEDHYGSLSDVIRSGTTSELVLKEIRGILNKYNL